jgi:hypothetical protein
MIKDEREDKEEEDSITRKRKHDEEEIPKEKQTEFDFPNTRDSDTSNSWCSNGKSKARAEKKRGKLQPNEVTYDKEYFICSEKKKGVKGENGKLCEAKKILHYLPEGIKTKYKCTHNHPSSNKKIDPEVQKKIEDYSKVGAKATIIWDRLMKDARESGQLMTRRNVPSTQHIYTTQHKLAMARLPTSMYFTYNSIFFY